MPGIADFLRGMFQPQSSDPWGNLRQEGASAPMDAPQPMNPLQRLLQPEVALPMAAGLMGNQGNMQNMGQAFANAGPALALQKERTEKTRTNNLTRDWLMTQRGLSEADADAAIANPAILTDYLKGPKEPTAGIQEYQYAKEQGYGGSFLDFQLDQKKAGANVNNVTVGGGKYGTIPQGYVLDESDPTKPRMYPVAGGPEDTSKTDARASGQADVATRVITSAAKKARDAAANRQMGGVGQDLMSNLPWTDSAEVARNVDVLKSQAKVQNLQAMRDASKTGGALGSVTKDETDMLAQKSGALDPNSPTFDSDLADYELTLLQVVHGPDEGTRIFQEQGGGAQQQQSSGARKTKSGVSYTVNP